MFGLSKAATPDIRSSGPSGGFTRRRLHRNDAPTVVCLALILGIVMLALGVASR